MYLTIFTNNIWSYSLWSPGILISGKRRSCHTCMLSKRSNYHTYKTTELYSYQRKANRNNTAVVGVFTRRMVTAIRLSQAAKSLSTTYPGAKLTFHIGAGRSDVVPPHQDSMLPRSEKAKPPHSSSRSSSGVVAVTTLYTHYTVLQMARTQVHSRAPEAKKRDTCVDIQYARKPPDKVRVDPWQHFFRLHKAGS